MLFVHLIDNVVRLAPQLVCDKEALKHFFRSRTRPPAFSSNSSVCCFSGSLPNTLACVRGVWPLCSLPSTPDPWPWLIYRYHLHNAVHQEKPVFVMNRGPNFVQHLGATSCHDVHRATPFPAALSWNAGARAVS